MNEMGGIVNFDGAPVNADELLKMQQALSDYGCDESSYLVTDVAAICFCGYHTSTESRLTKQPLVLGNGNVLVFDGIVQNRKELIESLELSHARVSDVEIVAAGLSRQGSDFIKQIIGSFALAWWNQFRRRLIMARDHIGSRPLYYRATDQTLRFASEISVLLDSTTTLDNDYIAGFLGAGPKTELTPYQQVKAVKPATLMEIDGLGISSVRFWNLSDVIPLNYATDRAYEEHFQTLALKSISSVLESSSGPVFSELSGGLDSTAIVCLADEVTTRLGQEPIETLSRVHDESRTSDEREYIRLVEKQRAKRSVYIREEDFPILSAANSEPSIDGPNPFYCFAEYHRAVCRMLSSRGVRTLLSGKGGDQILGGNPSGVPELADLLVQGKLFSFARQLRIWSLASRGPCLPLLGQSVSSALTAYAPRLFSGSTHTVPSWIDEPFRERIYANSHSDTNNGFCYPSDLDQMAGFSSVVASISAQYRRQWGKLNVSYPWLYRPLVEFMQAIPFRQRVRPGQTRSLMRRSLQSKLPARIAQRRGKRSPSEAIVRAIRREFSQLHSLFDEPLIAAYGFAKRNELRATLNRARAGTDLTALSIVMAISLEVWLRRIDLSHQHLSSAECRKSFHNVAGLTIRDHLIRKSERTAQANLTS
jgi:asparagine synthase (glutamine-hydrolysing)